MKGLQDALHGSATQVHRYRYRMTDLGCMRCPHTFRFPRFAHTLLLRKHYFHIHNYSYLLLRAIHALELLWKSIGSCEKKEKSAARFPSKKVSNKQPSSFTQLDSISIESETGFTCCRSTSIGAGGLGVVL